MGPWDEQVGNYCGHCQERLPDHIEGGRFKVGGGIGLTKTPNGSNVIGEDGSGVEWYAGDLLMHRCGDPDVAGEISVRVKSASERHIRASEHGPDGRTSHRITIDH